MKSVVRLSIASFLLLALPLLSSAQRNDWRVVRSSGDTLSDCALMTLDDSLLTLKHNGSTMSLPVDSVDLLFYHKDSFFWTGAGYGFGAGFAVGAVIGAASYRGEGSDLFGLGGGIVASGLQMGFLCGVGGFAVGGVIGGSQGEDEMHKLSGMPHIVRLNMVRSAMLNERRGT